MANFQKIILLTAFLMLVSAPASLINAQAKREILTNAKIVELVRMGLSEALIVAKINRSDCQCDTSTTAIGKLKIARVSDAIIMAMMNSSEELEIQPNQNVSTTPATIENTLLSNLPPLPRAPNTFNALAMQGKVKTALVSVRSFPVRIDKSKGNDMNSIAAETAVNLAVNRVLLNSMSVAKASIGSGSAIGSVLILAGGKVSNIIPGLRNKSKSTYSLVYVISGGTAHTSFSSSAPKFELLYGNIGGLDPDKYDPAIIRLHPTENNYRLIGALKVKGGKSSFTDFIEDRLPTKVTRIDRGHSKIDLVNPLPSGQYALILRPLANVGANADGLLERLKTNSSDVFSFVFDFSIVGPSVPQSSLTKISTSNRTDTNQTTANSEPITKPMITTTANTNSLPIYGNITDIRGLNRIYIHAEDSQSRERIIKELRKAPQFRVVGNLEEAQIILEYKVLSRDSNSDQGNKELRVRGQLSAIFFKGNSRTVAWLDTAEYAKLTSGGIGFRSQHNESKLTERFVKAMRN